MANVNREKKDRVEKIMKLKAQSAELQKGIHIEGRRLAKLDSAIEKAYMVRARGARASNMQHFLGPLCRDRPTKRADFLSQCLVFLAEIRLTRHMLIL